MQHSGQSHEVQCSICDKTFAHPILMRKHKRGVHVDPSHECTQCQSKFTLKSKLNRHIKSVHNKVQVKQQIPDQAEYISSLVFAK